MSDRKCGNCLHNIRGTQYIPPCSQCRDYSLWAENPEPSELDQLQAELDKHRWIPVEERLPKRHKVKEYRSNMVLVCGDNEAWRACWRYDYNQWMNADFYGLQKPTHWKPIILPKGECKQNVFMAREERIAAFHKARGEKWSEEREQWIPKGE
ncbi:hypothetical protein LCGC14_1634790 [marine sediment metagenome]|uniref:DUF551 domain-containing protein n=1 Tax=marine sediment metagenome TaxID=412755 RepID=A0A0F9I1R6_9ZZZZ